MEYIPTESNYVIMKHLMTGIWKHGMWFVFALLACS
jgi:hypothetical protein